MAYRSSSEYFNDIQLFIDELENDHRIEASKRMKEYFGFIKEPNDEWKMFYRKMLLMKEEFGFKLTKDENKRLDDIIEAAKRVVNHL
jgi:hypothetical protein